MSSSDLSLFQGDCGKPGPPGSSGRPGAEVKARGLYMRLSQGCSHFLPLTGRVAAFSP